MGKGKVHPSPSLQTGPGGGVEVKEEAEAVLMRLLPAAVLAAAAPLGANAKEVLASLRSSAPPSPSPTPGRAGGGAEGKAEAAHDAALACGCFGCYTAYWSRWDGSPEAERAAIHRAIEAFEEHLAAREEREGGGAAGKGAGGGRRRKKRAAAEAAKEKAGKGRGKGKGK